MKKLLLIILTSGLSFLSAQNLSFSVQSSQGYTITCATPALGFSVFCTAASYSCSWISSFTSTTGSTAMIGSPGNFTVTVTSGTASATQTFAIYLNTVTPVSSASSTFQVVTGTNSPQAFTFTAVAPTANITHFFYSPVGGTMTSNAITSPYFPGGPGTYTHCIVDNANGCASCQPFVVSMGAPSTVGIEESRTTQDRIFPNPSNGLYSLQLSRHAGTKLTVYNSLGAFIKSHDTAEEGATLDLTEQPRGMYMVKISTTNGQFRYVKLVRE